MALYDNYKQSNSSYISQFAGSIVPETAGFVSTMKNRFDEAQEQDDLLLEAMGNMSHLQDEADTLYANELKQDYSNRMIERVKKGDYENMGRRTKRDAKSFVSEYQPLINRLQAFQAIQQKVLADEKIFSPEKKQEILDYIRTTNRTQKGPDGSYQRNANGRVALGAIQDWAYAKDVDVDTRLVDILKEVETELTQSGFSADGQGLMISQTNEVRSKEDIYKMAMQRLQSDPEIKAMLKRDATLATYNLSPAQLEVATAQRNISRYEELRQQGLSTQDIEQLAINSGMTVDSLKVRPLDAISSNYAQRGLSQEQAMRDFLRVNVEQELGEPHADLVSSILKVNKQRIDARQDPTFAARLKYEYDKRLVDYQAQIEKAEIISQFLDNPEGEALNYVDLHNNFADANSAYVESMNLYRNGIGDILGSKPTISPEDRSNESTLGERKREVEAWNNRMNIYLTQPEKQAELLRQTSDPSKKAELQALFDRHNSDYSSMIAARQAVEAIPSTVQSNAIDTAWSEFQKQRGKAGSVQRQWWESRGVTDKESLQKFITEQIGQEGIQDGYFSGYRSRDRGVLTGSYNKVTDRYIESLNEGVKSAGNVRTPVNVFEPYGEGYVKSQTDLITGLAKSNPNAFMGAGGSSLQEEIEKTAKDAKLDDRELTRYFNNLRVRMADRLGTDGNPQYVITLPDGSTKSFSSEALPGTRPREILARMLQSSAHTYTEPEFLYQVTNVSNSLAKEELLYTDEVMLDNTPVGKTVELNDNYGYKITNSAKSSNWGSPTTGNLMIKNPKTGGWMEIKDSTGRPDPLTKNITVEKLKGGIGMEVYNRILKSDLQQ